MKSKLLILLYQKAKTMHESKNKKTIYKHLNCKDDIYNEEGEIIK